MVPLLWNGVDSHHRDQITSPPYAVRHPRSKRRAPSTSMKGKSAGGQSSLPACLPACLSRLTQIPKKKEHEVDVGTGWRRVPAEAAVAL